jgi:hypothetical protein
MRLVRLSAALVCVFALAGIARAVEPNIVTNGGFEAGSFSGWTVSDPGYAMVVDFTFDGFYHANSGSYYAMLGSPFVSSISQDLTTAIGSDYTVSVELASDGELQNSFEIEAGGVDLLNLQNIPAQGYTLETGSFTADSTTTELSLVSMDNPSYLLLDDVSVTDPQPQAISRPVPLPGSFWLGLVAMGGLGVMTFLRRRRAL